MDETDTSGASGIDEDASGRLKKLENVSEREYKRLK
jgi:hypothetical protein